MVVSPLWHGSGFTLDGKSYQHGLVTAQTSSELCEENDVSVNRVQTQYIRVRQVESCHRISEEAIVALYLNNNNDSKTGLGLTTA